jgi:lipopolysaccharide/colanic/teichoic acid biosynthesis glycosyltransferase
MTRRGARVAIVLVTAAVVFGLAKSHAVRHSYDFTGSSRLAASLAFALVTCASAYAFGLPDLVRGRRGAVKASVASVALAVVAVSLLQLFVGDALLPRFVVFGAAAVLVPVYAAISAATASEWARGGTRDRVLFVGTPSEAALLRQDLELDYERPAVVAGAMTAEEALPTGATTTPLAEAVKAARANLLVLGRTAQAEDGIVHQAAGLHESGIRIRTLSLFYEQWLGKLPVSELERTSLMFDISELHRAVYSRASRVFDVALALAGFVVFLLTIPFVMIGNLVANRGPLFYRQPRVGKNGKVFSILKYRTMRPATSGLVNEWTSEDDPRITPFGRVLRLSHVDEIPQVLNILKGDLSVVGPRPEQPHYVEQLVAKLPFYDLRHLVRPGLTGWAQVKYGYAGNESDALEKLQYEFFYLRRQSLAFDARIVARTVRSVVRRRGR